MLFATLETTCICHKKPLKPVHMDGGQCCSLHHYEMHIDLCCFMMNLNASLKGPSQAMQATLLGGMHSNDLSFE